METSVSKEFLKVYEQISKLLKDIAEIGKDCYNASAMSYEDIEVPEYLSQLENDTDFVASQYVEEEIKKCLKTDGLDELKCTIPTEFEELHSKTLNSSDSSDNVATTEFVHSIVQEKHNDVVSCMVRKVDTEKFVTIDKVEQTVKQSEQECKQYTDDSVQLVSDDLSLLISLSISELSIPEKTSQLTNDSGFITINDVPGDLVTSVNGQTGNVLIDIPTIPTNVSAFTNDAGYITDPGVTSVNNKSGAVMVQENVLADWSATSGLSAILHKPALKRVATTGDYNDLDNTPAIPTNYAGSATTGGVANKSAAIPYSQVDSTSTATVFSATVDGITELVDGVCCLLKNGVVTSAANFTLNINNLGDKPVYSNMAAATRETNIFNVNYTMLFIYDTSRVEDGCWICYRGYYTESGIAKRIRQESSALPLSDRTYRYRLFFTSADGQMYVPANTTASSNVNAIKNVNQRPIDPFGPILYYGYSGIIEQNQLPASISNLYLKYPYTLGYSFNKTGRALELTHPAPVYIKCSPLLSGGAIIDEQEPYVQSLPNSDDGYIYILLGIAYSAASVELLDEHPVYYYKDGAIRLWTNAIYNEFLRKPVTIWETTGTGLVSSEQDIKENMTWQLTGLDMTSYKRVKIYTKAGKKTSGVDQDASNTPAVVLEMSLDNRAAGPTGGHFMGSVVGQKPNDASRLFTVTCAISADKTSFAVLRMSTLYGTAATANSDCNGYVFKIEGYYD